MIDDEKSERKWETRAKSNNQPKDLMASYVIGEHKQESNKENA